MYGCSLLYHGTKYKTALLTLAASFQTPGRRGSTQHLQGSRPGPGRAGAGRGLSLSPGGLHPQCAQPSVVPFTGAMARAPAALDAGVALAEAADEAGEGAAGGLAKRAGWAGGGGKRRTRSAVRARKAAREVQRVRRHADEGEADTVVPSDEHC